MAQLFFRALFKPPRPPKIIAAESIDKKKFLMKKGKSFVTINIVHFILFEPYASFHILLNSSKVIRWLK